MSSPRRCGSTGGAEGARSLLSTVAGSIITVVGLAFSITIVSLQLAAAQLGPRLASTTGRWSCVCSRRLATRYDRRDLHLALLGEAIAIRRAAAHAFRDPGDREAVYATFERLLKAVRPDVRRIYDPQAVA